MSDQPISEGQQNKEFPGGCLVAFGGVFFVVGLGAFWFMLISPFLKFQSASNWPSTECRILTADLREIRGEDRSSWKADFTYEYEVDGQRYVGERDRISILSGSRKSARKRLGKFPVGQRVPCWYNPSDPADSLLDREISYGDMIFAIVFPAIFSLVGGSVMWFGFAVMRKSRDKKIANRPPILAGQSENAFRSKPIRREPAPQANRLAESIGRSPGSTSKDGGPLPADILDREADQPQRLKPEASRLFNLLGLLFICGFWNGIVGVFVWVVIFDPPFGAIWGRIALGVFLIPFVGIGLVIAAGVVHSAISMFNPSVSVALSSGAIPRGGTVDVAWEISGGVRRIQNLKISVVGTEWARYVVGTDTRTEESVFEVILACQTARADEISFGSATVAVPADTMHSLDESNNQINWSVQVHGTIPWWPDVMETFPFRVTPTVVAGANNFAEEAADA